MKKEFERLPRNVVPNFYHLDITPSFETFKERDKKLSKKFYELISKFFVFHPKKFDGKVQIDVNVNTETNVIVMNTHQEGFKIDNSNSPSDWLFGYYPVRDNFKTFLSWK